VTDIKSGDALIGATVSIKGSTVGVAVNVDGKFQLSNLQPGKYILVIKYIGYQTKEISDVDVKVNDITPLDVNLEPATSHSLKEVTIRASYRQESVTSLYAKQKNSVQVTDGISADLIRRSPDRNTGDVLKRVSGTSVQEGKFVIVRGLAERYNANMLNGTVLPSSEPDRKAFAFDIIPSSLVDNIVIYKTATPDLPGDFAGGAINTITKDIPDNKFMEATVNVGYTSKATFKNNFVDPNPHGKYDWLGYDDGSRKLPSAYADIRSTYTSGTTSAEKIAIAQQFPNSFPYQTDQYNLPNIGLQFTTGNSKAIREDSKFGYNFSFNYTTGHKVTTGSRTQYNESNKDELLYGYDRNNFINYKTLGGVLNLGYTYGKNKFSFRNLYNNDFTINFEQTNNGINTGSDIHYKGFSVETTQNGLYSSILEGQHSIGERNILIDWNANYGLSYRNQPDQRIVTIITPPGQPEYISLSSENSPKPNDLGRVYSDLHENIYGGKVNLTYPFKWLNESQKFKLGGLIQHRSRDFTIDALGYTDAIGFGNRSVFLQNGLTIDNVFSPESVHQNGIDLSILDQSSTSYTGTADLDAGYAMFDNKFTDKLRFVWGARVERYNQVLAPAGKAEQTYDNTDVLPSGNLTYSLSDKINLRASYFKSINRPEFRELASFRYYDYQTNYIIIGNDQLERSTISNGDLRLEYFPSAGEIFSFSAFYKKFTNPIEQINLGNDVLSYENAVSAKDLGFEMELRKKLEFLSPGSFLKDMSFYVNASYIDAKVNLGAGRNVSTPLQGQSPYLINSGLYYAPSGSDFSFNVLYNRVGERLAFRGTDHSIDIYEKPRDILDFQVSKRLLNRRAELKLTFSDILGQPYSLYLNYGDPNKTAYNSKEDKTIQNRYAGFWTALSFKYNLSFSK
jgi:TonB-dependent receptor